MPGLCGVVGHGLDAAFCLSAFRRVHALNGLSFSENAYSGNSCLLASYALGTDEGTSDAVGRIRGSDAVLLLEGEIHNVDRIRRGLSFSDRPTAANVLLGAYLEHGPEFVEKLDGEFNVVIFEKSAGRLNIFNDYVGSYPMYYWLEGQRFAFGSEKKFLLALDLGPRHIDPVGLLQPFVHRHNLDDRTFIQSIKRLRPASILRFERGRQHLTSYGRHLGGRKLHARSSELVEEWSRQLSAATEKRVRSKTRLGISLSGGLDSRAIACSIDRATRPIWARTMGERNSREVAYAVNVAKSLGFEHAFEDISEYCLSSVVHRIVWRTEGETQFRDGLSTLTHRQTKENCDHLIGGWLGDVSSGAHLRPFMLIRMPRQKLVQKIFDWYVGYAQADFRAVFNADFLKRTMPLVRDAFAESHIPFSDLPGPRAHEMWDLRNRQTRMTVSSMPADSHLFGKIRPFFDRAYLDFVMSLPQRWRIGQNLYKAVIYSMGPEIRAIPNGNNNVLLRSSATANLASFVCSSGSGVLRRASAAFQPRGRGSAIAGHGFAQQTRCDSGLRAIIQDFVESSSFDDGIFSRRGILDVVDQHFRAVRDHSVLIGILATWAVALQYFVYSGVKSCPDEAQPRV